MHTHTLAFLGNLGGTDGIVLLILGLLIFGRRLPEVGKNLGKTIVEFKKGLSGKEADEQAQQQQMPEQRPVRMMHGRMSVSSPSGQGTKSLPSTEEV
jgi:sec-independent protein translocase protein TatA